MSWIRLVSGLMGVIAIATAGSALAETTRRMQDLSVRQGPWLLFGSFRGGDFSSSIHAIRMNGSGECRISQHASGRPGCLDPAASADGARLVFTRGGDGTHLVSLWWEANGQEEVRNREV